MAKERIKIITYKFQMEWFNSTESQEISSNYHIYNPLSGQLQLHLRTFSIHFSIKVSDPFFNQNFKLIELRKVKVQS